MPSMGELFGKIKQVCFKTIYILWIVNAWFFISSFITIAYFWIVTISWAGFFVWFNCRLMDLHIKCCWRRKRPMTWMSIQCNGAPGYDFFHEITEFCRMQMHLYTWTYIQIYLCRKNTASSNESLSFSLLRESWGWIGLLTIR